MRVRLLLALGLPTPTPTDPHTDGAEARTAAAVLLRALLGIEAFLLILAAAIPLGGVSLSISPLTEWWPWLLAPARILFGNALVDASIPPSEGWTALALVAVSLVGAAAVAALAAWRLIPVGARFARDRRWLIFVLAGAVVLGVTLVLLPALPSDDVFSYILYGRISAVHGANPLITVPGAFPKDPFLVDVYWRDTRSVYGAVWLLLSGGLVQIGAHLGDTLPVYVLLFKSLGLLTHLGNAVLVWAILGVLAPQRQLVGTLLYAWNPLCLLEFCASGHNDALMLFFLLLAIYFLARGWDLPATGALGLSIATKYMPIILVPFYLFLVWRLLLRERAPLGRQAWALGWRCGVIALVLVVTVVPYWAGTQTLGSLLYSPPAQNFDNSLSDTLAWPLAWLLQGRAHLPLFAARHQAVSLLKAVALAGFAVFWLAQFPRVRTLTSMFEAWGWALIGYSIIASGWFWPWYVTWAVAVVAVLPWQRLTGGTLLLAGSVLTLYGFLPLQSSPFYGYRAGLEFLPAIVFLAWPSLRRGWFRWATPTAARVSRLYRSYVLAYSGGVPEDALDVGEIPADMRADTPAVSNAEPFVAPPPEETERTDGVAEHG